MKILSTAQGLLEVGQNLESRHDNFFGLSSKAQRR